MLERNCKTKNITYLMNYSALCLAVASGLTLAPKAATKEFTKLISMLLCICI